MNPEIADRMPTPRTVTGIKKPARQLTKLASMVVLAIRSGRITFNGRKLTLIRPAGERHRSVLVEQLTVRRNRWPPKTPWFQFSKIRQSQRAQTEFNDVSACFLVELRK